ncbi:DUF1345 domain-containing protein [Knoellia sp. LjRoot47]|uniref:DUF1345 domain-containing protein n=1 Tax=Knoellia sp. LjRoot47 TaxID=3342330 RepID=UPI003ECE1BCA
MRRTRIHLAVGGVLLFAGLLVPLPAGAQWPAHLLVGWIVGALAFCIPVLRLAFRLDASATAGMLEGAEGGRTETDVIVIIAALASLGAVALMLLGDGSGGASSQVFEGLLSVLAVAAGWLALHTTYVLRYARHYLVNEPGCIDFNGEDPPRLSDFAYLSFTLGMTYQVSDTALKTPEVRRLVLRHTLLSYLFGTVIVAATINLVVGLASAN